MMYFQEKNKIGVRILFRFPGRVERARETVGKFGNGNFFSWCSIFGRKENHQRVYLLIVVSRVSKINFSSCSQL